MHCLRGGKAVLLSSNDSLTKILPHLTKSQLSEHERGNFFQIVLLIQKFKIQIIYNYRFYIFFIFTFAYFLYVYLQ